MQSHEERPSLCANCEERPAVKSYTYGKIHHRLCDRCFDRWSVQDVYQGQLRHLGDLSAAGKYDEALACLDSILEANRDRDHDAWLRRSIAHDRILVFLDAGRWTDALRQSSAWAQLGFADVCQRWMHATATAQALEALGREREAMTVLEDSLGYQEEKELPCALGVLTALACLSEKLSLPVDSKWHRIAEAVADYYGVEMPVRDSPCAAILALEEIARERQPRRPSG